MSTWLSEALSERSEGSPSARRFSPGQPGPPALARPLPALRELAPERSESASERSESVWRRWEKVGQRWEGVVIFNSSMLYLSSMQQRWHHAVPSPAGRC